MSTEVLAAIQEHAQATSTELKALRDANNNHQLELDAMKQAIAGGEGFEPSARTHKSVLSAVVKSQQITDLQNRSSKVARIPLNNVSIKALVNDSSATNTQFSTAPQRFDGIGNDPRRKLSLLDVIPSLPVIAGSFEYVALDAYTSAAAYQLTQGAQKAVQTTPTEVKTANIATIAVVQKASTQVLSDAPNLTQYLQGLMVHGIRAQLEAQLIAGVAGSGKITGLSAQATAFTATATDVADQIGEAITELDAAGWNADVIVMSPAQWNAIRSERSTTNGQYVAGSWNNPAAANVWGVPVITSSSIADDEILVMDSQQLLLLDRQLPVFDIAAELETNLLVMRAELRCGLAVLAESAVLKITIV